MDYTRSAKLGVAALLSLQALAGGVGQQLVSEHLSDDDLTRLREKCETSLVVLNEIAVLADDIEANPDESSDRYQLISAVERLSTYTQHDHDMYGIDSLPDDELLEGALNFADSDKPRLGRHRAGPGYRG